MSIPNNHEIHSACKAPATLIPPWSPHAQPPFRYRVLPSPRRTMNIFLLLSFPLLEMYLLQIRVLPQPLSCLNMNTFTPGQFLWPPRPLSLSLSPRHVRPPSWILTPRRTILTLLHARSISPRARNLWHPSSSSPHRTRINQTRLDMTSIALNFGSIS